MKGWVTTYEVVIGITVKMTYSEPAGPGFLLSTSFGCGFGASPWLIGGFGVNIGNFKIHSWGD